MKKKYDLIGFQENWHPFSLSKQQKTHLSSTRFRSECGSSGKMAGSKPSRLGTSSSALTDSSVPPESRTCRAPPGANPTKHIFFNFTHNCKIFLQIPMC
jgi:hypothetical protein